MKSNARSQCCSISQVGCPSGINKGPLASEIFPQRQESSCGVYFVFLLCDVLICIIDDSWVGLGGVLLDGAIRGVAEGHRHPVEQSLASNQLGC